MMFVLEVGSQAALLYVFVHTPFYAFVRHICGHAWLRRVVQSSISDPSHAISLTYSKTVHIQQSWRTSETVIAVL
ncbi:hypothetical protein LI328DRAFT_164388 [Trichoderma asperelloides]|nr:hypothetical protein LI328DRAFT_164388 [Trichoderma asperelloides]